MYQTAKLRKPQHFANDSKSATKRNSQSNEMSPAKPVITDIGDATESDVLCINCMKMVKVSMVAEHSLNCIQVHTEVKLIDQCSLVQQADYKIRRLKDSVAVLSRDAELLRKVQSNAYYIQMLAEYCTDILDVAGCTKADILKCREIIFNINSLIKGFKGSPALSVYIERLLVLSKEKYAQTLKYYKEIAASDPSIAGGMNFDKSKEELKNLAVQKTEKLRKSIGNASIVRLSLGKSKVFSPGQLRNAITKAEDVVSDAGADMLALSIIIWIEPEINQQQ